MPDPVDYTARLEDAIDKVIDIIEAASHAGVEVDPLAAIVTRMRARGEEIDLADAPPMLRMLLSGMGV